MLTKSIEEFIQYKIEHQKESRLNAELYKKHKKYQKELDILNAQFLRKGRQLQLQQIHLKKVEANTWKKTLQTNRVIHNIDEKKFQFIERIKEKENKEEERKLALERKKQAIKQQEIALEEQLIMIESDSQFYFQERMNLIQEQKQRTKNLQEEINETIPQIEQYNDRLAKKQKLNQEVTENRRQNQNKTSQVWKLSSNYDLLEDTVKKMIENKQKQEKQDTEKKKKKIQLFIYECNRLLEDDNIRVQKLIEQKKKQMDQIPSEKPKNISLFDEEPSIQPGKEEELRTSIAKLKTQNQSLSKREEQIKQKMMKMEEQEQKSQEQIKTLSRRVEEMNKNLRNK